MKTKEQIKQEFKNATGWELPIYSYNGEEGVIYDDDFKTIDELMQMQDIDYDCIRWTYEDGYGGYEGCMEIDRHQFVCIENEQKLNEGWASNVYAESDEYNRELCVITDKYYDWKSDRTRMIESLVEDIESGFSLEPSRKLWETIVSRYKDPLGTHTKSVDFASVVEDALCASDVLEYEGYQRSDYAKYSNK